MAGSARAGTAAVSINTWHAIADRSYHYGCAGVSFNSVFLSGMFNEFNLHHRTGIPQFRAHYDIKTSDATKVHASVPHADQPFYHDFDTVYSGRRAQHHRFSALNAHKSLVRTIKIFTYFSSLATRQTTTKTAKPVLARQGME